MTTTCTTCTTCARPMRPRGTDLANYPGTVAEHARGMCWRCYRQAAHQTLTYDLSEVRRLAAAGMSDREIGQELGVTPVAIRKTRARYDIPAGIPWTRTSEPRVTTRGGHHRHSAAALPDVDPATARAAAITVAAHVPVAEIADVLAVLGLAPILTGRRAAA